MQESELVQFQEVIDELHDRFAGCFGRAENRVWARKYLTGLMMTKDRRNCWNLAEELQLTPKELKSIQRFLYTKTWNHKTAIEHLAPLVDECIGVDDGVLIVDESGVRKWGKKSVGVGRQYLGCIGKRDNGQVGVYLTYTSEIGRAFLDTRLYILQDWFQDRKRCREAGIPESVVFRTKPELAGEMVRAAMGRGIRARWLTADELYGQNTTFLDEVDAFDLWYVVEVPKSTEVWTSCPKVEVPRPRGGRGGPRKKPRLSADSPHSERVDAIEKTLDAGDWKRITVGEGTKGILTYEFAFRRVFSKRSALPGPDCWLMFRRSLEQEPEVKYFLSNAPILIDQEELAIVGSIRWTVESCIKEAKGQTGLDEYEARCWNSWHHHTVLSLLAHAFLMVLSVERKKNRVHDLASAGATPDRPGSA